MLSLYIHIPFCDQQCQYCSFAIVPTKDLADKNKITHKLITTYQDALLTQIARWGKQLPNTQINTIYFGGGTPPLLGIEKLCEIIDTIDQYFDLSHLSELSIECNPEPNELILELVRTRNQRYKHFPRIRYSIGIQSFDDQILQQSGRQYTFNQVVPFLRELQFLKKPNNCINLDFIAFGKLQTYKNGYQQLRDPAKLDFFQTLVESHFADGISLYTLELFPGSPRYYQRSQHTSHDQSGLSLKQYGSDEDVYTEFSILKDIILAAGYRRYELSNFCLPGRSSIHNRVYRNMQNYLGLGLHASSFANIHTPTGQHLTEITRSHLMKKGTPALPKGEVSSTDANFSTRRTNPKPFQTYTTDPTSIASLTPVKDQDFLIEQGFLALRTDRGRGPLTDYTNILVSDYPVIIAQLTDQGFCTRDPINNHLHLTDTGMDVYNDIITSLLQNI